ncbi:unnamed protein product [Urochloa humidicola]
MAIPVARVHLAMAHAALPALLPTPPKCLMLPLLPTPPCPRAVVLPISSPPKAPSRADADERWDARKNAPSKPGRADSDGRWDAHKINAGGRPESSSSSGSSSSSTGRASSCERWDSNKPTASVASSSSTTSTANSSFLPPPKRASLSDRWDSNKRRARKPGAPPRTDELDDGESSTGSSRDMGCLDMPPPPPTQPWLPRRALYAGPGFIASPEPGMLPKPSFMVRVA